MRIYSSVVAELNHSANAKEEEMDQDEIVIVDEFNRQNHQHSVNSCYYSYQRS